MNEAIMEEEAKQGGRDILAVGVNLRHCRPHDLLGVGTWAPIEIVLETGRRSGRILNGGEGDDGGRLHEIQTVIFFFVGGRRRWREEEEEFV